MDYGWFFEFLKGMLKPVVALAVVAMAVALSYAQRLGLEWEMVYSIFRAFLQLSIIGFVLQFIFSQQNSGWIVLAYLFMVSLCFLLPLKLTSSHQIWFEVFSWVGVELCWNSG